MCTDNESAWPLRGTFYRCDRFDLEIEDCEVSDVEFARSIVCAHAASSSPEQRD